MFKQSWIGKKNKDFEHILESSLEFLENGEPVEAVLARYPEQAGELRAHLEAAGWLRAGRAAFEPRPGFVNGSRAWLVEQIERQQVAPVSRPVPWVQGLALMWNWLRRRRRLAWQLAAALLLLAMMLNNGGQLALAARLSLPGDALYSVKTGMENARLIGRSDAVSEARLHTEFARQRLLEIQSLVFEGSFEELHLAVDDLETHTRQAVDAIIEVAGKNPKQGRQLAFEFQDALQRHAGLISVLQAFAASQSVPELERAYATVLDGLRSVEKVLVWSSSTPVYMLKPATVQPLQAPQP